MRRATDCARSARTPTVADAAGHSPRHRATRRRNRRSGDDKEIALAFRRLIEQPPRNAALVLIFEDIHWAEPALLDLIEYLATWTRDAPLLIVCPSRPGAARHAAGVGQRPDGGEPDQPRATHRGRVALAARGAADGGGPAAGAAPARPRPRRRQPAVRRGSRAHAHRGAASSSTATAIGLPRRRRPTCACRTASRR